MSVVEFIECPSYIMVAKYTDNFSALLKAFIFPRSRTQVNCTSSCQQDSLSLHNQQQIVP